MGVRARLGAAALTACLVLAVAGQWPFSRATGLLLAKESSAPQQKTTKSGLYTKEQADRGAELYVKHCERCHTPEKVPEGKKPGAPIFGDKFFDNWADKTLGELFAIIRDTMPSDGTATLTVDETLDVTAHLLKANGMPDGPQPLKNDDTMKSAVIVKKL